MKRGSGIFFIICLLTVAACDAVLGPPGSEPPMPSPMPSPPYDMFIEGEPGPGAITLKGGFYIWKIGNSWHLRVARTDIPRTTLLRDVFAGSVSVENGFVVNLQLQNARPIDVVQTDQRNIGFRIEVERDIKGFDFRVQPGMGFEYCVLFQFQTNGLMDPQFVHLGRSMFVPNSLPIRMCFRQ